jgi:hypothetical protein
VRHLKEEKEEKKKRRRIKKKEDEEKKSSIFSEYFGNDFKKKSFEKDDNDNSVVDKKQEKRGLKARSASVSRRIDMQQNILSNPFDFIFFDVGLDGKIDKSKNAVVVSEIKLEDNSIQKRMNNERLVDFQNNTLGSDPHLPLETQSLKSNIDSLKYIMNPFRFFIPDDKASEKDESVDDQLQSICTYTAGVSGRHQSDHHHHHHHHSYKKKKKT